MSDVRQRSLLASLGISLWVPKLARTRKSTLASPAAVSIWRDVQDESGAATSHLVQTQPVPQVPPAQAQVEALAVAAVPVHKNIVEAVKPAETPAPQSDSLSLSSQPIDTAQFVDQPLIATTALRFSLQAVEINHWVLLMDDESLQDAAARQLWGNICSAFNNPEVLRFNWPLADGIRWQHPLGAKAALNGFLFRMGMDKRVGLMGQLQDEVAPDRVERLPTLQELIEQPLKKRSLWLLLKQQ